MSIETENFVIQKTNKKIINTVREKQEESQDSDDFQSVNQ